MEIPKRVIARFCRYRATLMRLQQYGMTSVFSEELAQALELTSAQVRKDFSLFHIPGKKKAGYRIDLLMGQLNHILRKTKTHQAILLGAGPFALSLAQEFFTPENGIAVTAFFEEDKTARERSSPIKDAPVLPLSRLIRHVRSSNVRYAILAVTDNRAQRFLDEAVLAGIRGFFNLSGRELKAPRACVLHSVNLTAEIENLIFFTQRKQAQA
jgi:redox-sensing transcriptional repressor